MLNIKDIRKRNHVEPDEVKEIRENIINSFKNLEFQEGPHKYFLHNDEDNIIEIPSVSGVTHKFAPHFDQETQATAYALKNNMLVEDVLRMWEENNVKATNNGTSTHLFGEAYMHFVMGNIDKIPDIIKPQYEKGYLIPYSSKQEAIVKFFEDLHVNDKVYPIMPEAQVYMGINPEYNDIIQYAGTFDMLFTYKATDGDWKLLLYDYKTNSKLYKDYARKFNKMALEPFTELYDESYSYYILQLSAYSLCLNQLGYEVADRKIIWLKDDATYEKISVPDYTVKLRDALNKDKYYKF
jgi:hypothetical protein